MAKFFFKKDRKSSRPLRSQVAGVVWISMVLMFLAGLALFVPKVGRQSSQSDSLYTADTAILSSREDSVYHSRRTTRNQYPYSNQYSKPTPDLEDNRQYDPIPYPTHSNTSAAREEISNRKEGMRRQRLLVELNSADTTTMQLLYGIGPVFARRIVRYRDRLGGFVNTDQLLEVYGFTPSMLEDLAPNIKVDSSTIEKLPINSISLKQLIKHPYIEYYQARDIVNLRNRGVHFNNADDLRAVPSMADSTLQRLLPYISFD